MVAWNLLILKRSMILRTRTDVLNILFADLSLENRALKDVIEKTLKPAFKHELITHMITTFGLSIRQARRSLNLNRTVYHYCPNTTRGGPIVGLNDTHDTVFQSFSKSCDSRDPRGITKDLPYLLTAKAEFSS